jgi:hypothetical protein
MELWAHPNRYSGMQPEKQAHFLSKSPVSPFPPASLSSFRTFSAKKSAKSRLTSR